MGKVNISSLLNFSDNGSVVCNFDGKRLTDLEKLLSIIKLNKGNLGNLDFFEFGTSHYNLSSYGARSSEAGHFMGFGSGLNYRCFDAYNTEGDFDVIRESMEAYFPSKKFDGTDIVSCEDERFEHVIKKIQILKKEKDIDDTFVLIRDKEYYDKFFQTYEKVDLDELKKGISNFAVGEYKEILNVINQSENPVIFSQGVLNAPNFSFNFPFMNIKKGFHIHDVSISEIFEILEENKFRYKYPEHFGGEYDLPNFINKFKERYRLDPNLDVSFESDRYTAIFYWNIE